MKKIAAITLALSATLATGLQAGDLPAGWTSYDAGKFAAAVKTSQTMVVDVHADWCPTCRAQAPILQELRRDEQLKSVRFVRVDWDKDKDFVRRYRIPRQSTIVVFRKGKESGRSIAETNPAKLRRFVLNSV